MEEGAPLDPSSGGTPTAMVAVPMLSTALGQRFSMLGGTGVGTKMEALISAELCGSTRDFDQTKPSVVGLATGF